MTDTQFGALLSFLAAFGTGMIASLRWAANRIVKALDENSEAHRKSSIAMAEAMTMIKFAYDASRDVKDFIQEERSGVHGQTYEDENTPVDSPKKKRLKSQPYGPLKPEEK